MQGPYTLNPVPETLNPKPVALWAIDPEPGTLCP
jgi:hypothetical protein